jgi:uncharacterized protein YaeQ
VALKATIFKADLDISDMDRHYYESHSLTLARHASETDERMMVRLLAFALNAHEHLAFSEGLSNAEEPALWRKDLTGVIELWIEVGQPDEKRLLKACGRADQVIVYSYSSGASIWWNQLAPKVERARNLSVVHLPNAAALSSLVDRTMSFQITISEGQLFLTAGDETLEVHIAHWRGSGT